jgi:hypothetical protein
MNTPDVKIIGISNVYCRSMHFKKQGDVELGHCHTYDHGTLVSTGKLLVEMLRDDDTVISQKEFTGPSFIFISKWCRHRLTALEDNTVAVCIHAMRDIHGELLSPDFLIDEKWFADTWEDSDNIGDHYHLYTEVKRKVETSRFSITPNQRDALVAEKNEHED